MTPLTLSLQWSRKSRSGGASSPPKDIVQRPGGQPPGRPRAVQPDPPPRLWLPSPG
jgi:hypothetical protein